MLLWKSWLPHEVPLGGAGEKQIQVSFNQEWGQKLQHQQTRNAGLSHVECELSRRGWSVERTKRHANASDLYASNADKTLVLHIQSRALSRRGDAGLGRSLDTLRPQWWIITVNANSNSPDSYILTLDEVKAAAASNTNKRGVVSYWLPYKKFAVPKFQEAWARLDSPSDTANFARLD